MALHGANVLKVFCFFSSEKKVLFVGSEKVADKNNPPYDGLVYRGLRWRAGARPTRRWWGGMVPIYKKSFASFRKTKKVLFVGSEKVADKSNPPPPGDAPVGDGGSGYGRLAGAAACDGGLKKPTLRPVRAGGGAARWQHNRSLLLLFFRKEGFCLLSLPNH